MKNRYVLLADLPLIAVASFGAYAVRFDWRFYEQRPEFALYLLAALVIKPAIFLLLGMYQRYWRYASVQELVVVVIAVTASSMGMAVAVMLVTVLGVFPKGFSRTVVFTDWPPGPEEQKVSMRRSLASILMSMSSASGRTATVAAEV